ncbi:MAG: aromatic ring-cleaving dioxygenase [Acidocella sp. 20-57-95]|nr:MAG: aromatic ring-cleaving dioxygenase [Acidocella sp. 20-57-95]OYV61732.1 MAG: aromatic ring-cleaving dioxygenase [Acidocella sp. 21-58-7]HQT65196.1 DOPA 4,5-dioxygenase family protein [Acidocella sp.]HQU04643.1 DOPA 4,5-dioxygenase family protein [Acidocella sp.]
MIPSYHAHIYYRSPAERAKAEQLRAQISERFLVRLGRWHDVPVGPHTAPMFQVAFLADIFPAFIPWLMLNRQGLPILLHPNTGRVRDDHITNPFWFGEILPAKGEILPEESDEVFDMAPNTAPTIK